MATCKPIFLHDEISRVWNSGGSKRAVCLRRARCFWQKLARIKGEPPEREPLVCGMAERWRCGLAWCRPCRPQTEIGHGTTAADRQSVEARCAGTWLRNGSVDIATSIDCDRAHHRSALSPRSRMEDFGVDGLEPATARQAGTTTR